MITIPIEIGDIVRVGRFKNKRIKVKSITQDEHGLPLINGRPLLTMRIEKLTKQPKQETTMKKQDLQKLIREEVAKVIKEADESPASNLLSLLAGPDIKQYMDKLSDTISDQDFMAVKGLYDKLYTELKKHEAVRETYYNPQWKLTSVQSWLDGYAKKNNLPFKLIHKTDKNSNIGRHAKTNTYYVYDIGDKYGIVIRNEKVPGAPRLDDLYVIIGVKGTALGSLTNASTLADGSEQELYKMLDKVLV